MKDNGSLEVQYEAGSDATSHGNELMSECLMREEVEQALGSLRRD